MSIINSKGHDWCHIKSIYIKILQSFKTNFKLKKSVISELAQTLGTGTSHWPDSEPDQKYILTKIQFLGASSQLCFCVPQVYIT